MMFRVRFGRLLHDKYNLYTRKRSDECDDFCDHRVTQGRVDCENNTRPHTSREILGIRYSVEIQVFPSLTACIL